MSTVGYNQSSHQARYPYKLSGTFCNKGEKCENGPNLPLSSLEVFICGESSPKFTMYRKTKANGSLTRENQNANNKSVEKVQKHNKSKTSTHSHQEEGIERGCEEEREGSPVPIFPPLRFRIVRMFPGSVGFDSQVSTLQRKRGSTSLKFWPTIIEKRKLREVVRKRGKVPLYPYFHP